MIRLGPLIGYCCAFESTITTDELAVLLPKTMSLHESAVDMIHVEGAAVEEVSPSTTMTARAATIMSSAQPYVTRYSIAD